MLPTKTQIKRLKATGKVADIEDEGMDDDRFFVHLQAPFEWPAPYQGQRTKSFGSYLEAAVMLQRVKR